MRLEDGERAYNLGKFKEAVDLFTQAYEQFPNPAYLFNIAQTYRQSGDCKQAQFFYKRFLALKQQDTKKPLTAQRKAEVESRIAELEECIRRELANKPPDQLDNGQQPKPNPNPNANPNPPDKLKKDVGQKDEGEEEEEEQPEAPPAVTTPKLVSVRAIAGLAKLNAAGLNTPFQFAAAIIGGYPLAVNKDLVLDLGAAFSYTPVPYTVMPSGAGHTGGLIGVMANVGPSYTVLRCFDCAIQSKLALRADVGVGVQLFTGLEADGNPFTEGGAPATGALATFLARVGVSADYAVTPNIVLTLTPFAFSYSPVPTGFQPMITSLTTFSFLAGIGYRQ
jgi:hypothetical protein